MTSDVFIDVLRFMYATAGACVVGWHGAALIRSFSRNWARPHDPFWALFCLTWINRLWLAGAWWLGSANHHPNPETAAYNVIGYISGIGIAILMLLMPVWYNDRP